VVQMTAERCKRKASAASVATLPRVPAPRIRSNQCPGPASKCLSSSADGKMIRLRLPWFCGDEFACRICGLLFFHAGQLKSHVRLAHGLGVQAYEAARGSLRTRSVEWTCSESGQRVQRDYVSIRRHLEDELGLSMAEYVQRHNPESYWIEVQRERLPKSEWANTGEPRAKRARNSSPWERSMPNLAVSLSRLSEDELERYCAQNVEDALIQVKEEPADENGVQEEEPEKDEEGGENADENKYPFENLEEFLRGGCIFECARCHIKANDSTQFWEHVADQHRLDPSSYKEAHGEPLAQKSRLECPSCYKIFLHEPTALARHARSHGVDPGKYYLTLFAKNEPKKQPAAAPVVIRLPKPASKLGVSAADRWANKCFYRCKICGKEEFSPIRMGLHAKRSHGLDQEMLKATYGTFQVRHVLHKCKLCGEEMKMMTVVLSKHIASKHGMKLDEYYHMFQFAKNPNDSCREVPVEQPEIKRNQLLPLPADLPGIPAPSKSAMMAMAPTPMVTKGVKAVRAGHSGRKESGAWGDAATFGCKICGIKFPTQYKMATHLKNAHNLTPTTYKAGYGSIVLHDPRHCCLLCSRWMQHTSNSIAAHLYCYHNKMKLSEYYESYVKPTIDQHQPQPSTSNGQSATEDLEERRLANPQLLEDYLKMEEDEAGKPDVHFLSSHPSIDDVGKADWMNGCSYACALCQGRLTSMASFREHVEDRHHVSFVEYFNEHGDPTEKMAVINCAICNEAVTHDPEEIAGHLLLSHDLSPDAYYKQYVLTGAVAPPTAETDGSSLADGDVMPAVEVHLGNNDSLEENDLGLNIVAVSGSSANEENSDVGEMGAVELALLPDDDAPVANRAADDIFEGHDIFGNGLFNRDAINGVANDNVEAIVNGTHQMEGNNPVAFYKDQPYNTFKSSLNRQDAQMHPPPPLRSVHCRPRATEGKYDWNACLFFCPACPKRLCNYGSMQMHAKTHHHLGMASVKMRVKRSSPCLVCGENVKVTSEAMKNHLAKHAMYLPQYERDYESQVRQMLGELHEANNSMPHPGYDENLCGHKKSNGGHLANSVGISSGSTSASPMLATPDDLENWPPADFDMNF